MGYLMTQQYIHLITNNKMKNLTNIKTNEVILNFESTLSNYLVKCDSPKYATHIDESGNYFCMYGTFAAFDGAEIIKLNK